MNEREGHRVAAATSANIPSSERTRLRRKADRGRYDWVALTEVFDAGLVCHVGLVLDAGPVVIPMAYGRVGRSLYLHGASGNATLRGLSSGTAACVTVTVVDGLVLSRSAFHHSVNYRSAVCFGRAEAVRDHAEKHDALMAIVEHMVPGRSTDTRPSSPEELRATLVVRFEVDEGSAKVRSGGPIEEPADLSLDHWAGQLPLKLDAGDPIADQPDGHAPPEPAYLREWAQRRGSARR